MSSEPVESAMFPLASVLLPGGGMPLRVFEPRYRRLLDSLDPDTPHFGVVLIERGPEVGGGDVRADVGCRAEVLDMATGPDGDVLVALSGRERIRVVEWLTDDPFPRAMVETLADPAPRVDDPVHRELLAAFTGLVELSGGSGAEAVEDTRPWLDDPVGAGYRIANALPLGPLDAYGALAALDTEDRARRLLDAIEGFELVIRSRSDE